jgi:tRNA nucleotidyltransferase (CCA-adding enzyme)
MGAGDRMPGNGRTRDYARRASAGAAFALFPHDADLGVTGQGPTVEIAFEQAARAITAAITDAKVAETERVTLRCDAPDLELLLVTWLNAVIAEMAVRSMLFGRFRVRIDGTHLDAELWGEPIDPPRHAPACEPKGATCAMLEVRQDAEGLWHARCIIDV